MSSQQQLDMSPQHNTLKRKAQEMEFLLPGITDYADADQIQGGSHGIEEPDQHVPAHSGSASSKDGLPVSSPGLVDGEDAVAEHSPPSSLNDPDELEEIDQVTFESNVRGAKRARFDDDPTGNVELEDVDSLTPAPGVRGVKRSHPDDGGTEHCSDDELCEIDRATFRSSVHGAKRARLEHASEHTPHDDELDDSDGYQDVVVSSSRHWCSFSEEVEAPHHAPAQLCAPPAIEECTSDDEQITGNDQLDTVDEFSDFKPSESGRWRARSEEVEEPHAPADLCAPTSTKESTLGDEQITQNDQLDSFDGVSDFRPSESGHWRSRSEEAEEPHAPADPCAPTIINGSTLGGTDPLHALIRAERVEPETWIEDRFWREHHRELKRRRLPYDPAYGGRRTRASLRPEHYEKLPLSPQRVATSGLVQRDPPEATAEEFWDKVTWAWHESLYRELRQTGRYFAWEGGEDEVLEFSDDEEREVQPEEQQEEQQEE